MLWGYEDSKVDMTRDNLSQIGKCNDVEDSSVTHRVL
jgi:hypothetical protein